MEKYQLEKIKTIGDAYMIVSGVPMPRDDHAVAIADLALSMRTEMEKYSERYGLNIRIGICSGPVVAGIIGKRKFLYDLWGDTVNTASRMESHGLSGEIQVSIGTYENLKDKYRFEYRGFVDIKGKGQIKTYFLKDIL